MFQKAVGLTDVEAKDWFNKEMTTKLIAFRNARFII